MPSGGAEVLAGPDERMAGVSPVSRGFHRWAGFGALPGQDATVGMHRVTGWSKLVAVLG